MSTYERIRSLQQRVELLAPAGRWNVLEAVLDAGADAVYLSAKQFNMRMHRSDFHFTDAQLADAAALVHRLERRLYVTVNAMLTEDELPEVRRTLIRLDSLGVDAIIVQDLATLRLARDVGCRVALHASTMMNVHNAEQARALKSLGVRRVIASRDISLQAIGQMGRDADVEVECFVHGDMCAVQSGQCSLSGQMFGKSANRGQCMKPCRWRYDLVRLDEDGAPASVRSGHLLAIKDLCMIGNIPDIAEAGICSLKIEGRMRDAAFLHVVVSAYREAIDAWYDCPNRYHLERRWIERLYRQQVRSFSILGMLGRTSQPDEFDPSGEKEPLFLSAGCDEQDMEEHLATLSQDNGHCTVDRDVAGRMELAVCVGDVDAGLAAIEAGADRIYLAAELPRRGAAWSTQILRELAERARRAGTTIGLRTPRITPQAEWPETQWLLRQAGEYRFEYVLAHHPGSLQAARTACPDATIIADYGFNLLNSAAVDVVGELGAGQATVSTEAGLTDIEAMTSSVSLPLELLTHGPVTGMLMEHCLIALYASTTGRRELCRGPCRHVDFCLRDTHGQLRPIVGDQYCRNHLLNAHDLAILPALERFLLKSVASLRIEAHFYAPQVVAAATRAYRQRLNLLAKGHANGAGWREAWRALQAVSPRPFNLGSYTRSILRSPTTASLMRSLSRRSALRAHSEAPHG